MILRLALAQARSQMRYAVWTAVFIALALGSVAFTLLILATQRAMWEDVRRLDLADRAHHVGGPQFFGQVPDAADNLYGPAELQATVEDVDRALAEAIAGGSDVAALRSWAVVSRPTTAFAQLTIAAATGDYDWDLVVAEGRLPRQGEVLLNARVAGELHLGVGDSLDLLYRLHPPSAEEPATEADWHTFEISGLARSCDDESILLEGIWWCADYSYVSWEESSSPAGPLACTICAVNEAGDTAPLIPMTVTAWNIGHPTLERLPALAGSAEGGLQGSYEDVVFGRPSVPRVAQVGYGFAGLVVFGMILGALSVGRAQAQARTQWVATARTLGATRRAVVASTLLESLLVASVASVCALTLGYGVASAAFPSLRGFHGPTIGPSSVQVTWWVVAAVALGAVVLSLVVAAVPAFWASRVTPVAAFKPVPEVTEAEISRHVSLWWIVPIFLGGIASIWLGTHQTGSVGLGGYLGVILVGTTGFFLLREGLHALITKAGTRLGRSRSRVLQVVGDGFVASPRRAATLALLFALPIAALAGLAAFDDFSSLGSHLAAGLPASTWPSLEGESGGLWASEAVIWASVVGAEFECVALAITFAHRWANTSEAATRRALGLSTLHQREAAFVTHAAPQILGAIAGAVLGFVAGAAMHFLFSKEGPGAGNGAAHDYLSAWTYSALNAGYAVLLVVAFASVGALVVAAAASRIRPPVDDLKPAGKGHTR